MLKLLGFLGGPLSWIVSLFSSGLGQKVADYFTAASNNAAATEQQSIKSDEAVNVAQINGRVALGERTIAAVDNPTGMWMKKWAFIVFFFGDITPRVLDNTFTLNWHIPPLEPSLANLETDVLLVCLGYVALNGIVGRIFSRVK